MFSFIALARFLLVIKSSNMSNVTVPEWLEYVSLSLDVEEARRAMTSIV